MLRHRDIDLPAIYVANIKKDQIEKIGAVFDDDPTGREFPMKTKEAATEADPITLTYRVTFTMPPPDGLRILPGMSATVKVPVPSVRALFLLP